MSNDNLCRFGAISIKTRPGHIHLANNLPRFYDFAPWRLIADLVTDQLHSGQLTSKPTLIDVGANIGDSAAIWRNHFDTEVLCIEPSERFYGLLEENAKYIKNCVLVKKLYNASVSSNQISFTSGKQTGSTRILTETGIASASKDPGFICISLEEILAMTHSPSVFKTDTDGFDVHILSDVVQKLGSKTPQLFPVIFAEGPTKLQMESLQEIGRACEVYSQYLSVGYRATIFTNFGHLYCHCGSSIETVRSCFFSARQGILNRRKACGYFDIVLSTNENAHRIVESFATSYAPSRQ